MSLFQKATRKKNKLRLAIAGPSGVGKTYTSLTVGKHFGKIAYIDTEHRSASRYAGLVADFDVLEFEPPFHPDRLIYAINEAEKAGYDVVIVDSLSHFWAGQGGILEIVDEVAAKNRARGNYNNFTAWKDGTKIFNDMVEKIIRCQIHIICCMRSKAEYLQTEDSKGKKKIEKVGTAPIQRDGLEYEFDLVLDMDVHHNAVISKSRVLPPLPDVMRAPGDELAKRLLEWTETGVAVAKEPLYQPAENNPAPSPESSEPVAETEPVKTWADLPKNKQQSIAIRRKELADSIEWGPKYSGYDEWIESAGILGLKPDGKPSFAVSTVDQINRAMAFLEKLATERPKQSEPPKDSLPVSEATRQAATANGVIDPAKFDSLDPREVLTKTMAAVKSKDVRLHSVLADAQPSIVRGRLQLSFPDGYDWHYGQAVAGINTLCECADMPVDLHLEPAQVSA